jgi:hypothetical protein
LPVPSARNLGAHGINTRREAIFARAHWRKIGALASVDVRNPDRPANRIRTQRRSPLSRLVRAGASSAELKRATAARAVNDARVFAASSPSVFAPRGWIRLEFPVYAAVGRSVRA